MIKHVIVFYRVLFNIVTALPNSKLFHPFSLVQDISKFDCIEDWDHFSPYPQWVSNGRMWHPIRQTYKQFYISKDFAFPLVNK